MSRKTLAPTLHIEWSPTFVQAVDVATGQTASGADLSELSSFVGGQHRQALVGVSRSLVFLKSIRLPKADPEDLRRIVGVQIGKIFPLPADQLAWDFLQSSDDETAEGCLTIVAAMRADDLRLLREQFAAAGIVPARILPVALGAPVVAVGAGFPDALIVEPYGSGLALDVVQRGTIRFSRVVAAAGDPLCEAQRTLAAAGAGEMPVLATGGLHLPETYPANGTALGRLDEAPQSFGFELAEDRAREAARRVASRTRLAVLLMLSALLLVALIWADRSDARAAARRGEGAWARQLSQLRSTRNYETTRAQRAAAVQETLERAFEPAQPLSDITRVVADSLPAGAWLTGLSIERGKPLQVRGTAKSAADVSRFVDALAASPRFRDVKLVFANSARIENTQVVQFNVTATAVGNLPMPAPARPGARGASSRGRTTATGAQQPR